MNEVGLMRFLDEQGIAYQRFDHAAVYTCEQSASLLPHVPGAGTKNLFVCDEKGKQYFLIMFLDDKRIDFKRLGTSLGVGKLSFAPAEDMKEILGLEPGAVTVFAAANDASHTVEVLIDRELWLHETIHSHPLVNTATLVISPQGVERFLKAAGCAYRLVDIPVKG
jgi:Ala-tRNA(Pro) deacylase